MSKLMKLMVEAPRFAGTQSLQGLLLSLGFTLALTLAMMWCYRLCHDSLTYHHKFNITLMMLSLASTVLMILIQSHPMFSLGALGALSICRIRTNTRDPRDLGFVFWALMIGISSAMQAFSVGCIGTLAIGLTMLVFAKTEHRQKDEVIVVRGEKANLPEVRELLSASGCALQSENIFSDAFELVYSLKLTPEKKNSIMQLLENMEGINDVNLLAPETEVV